MQSLIDNLDQHDLFYLLAFLLFLFFLFHITRSASRSINVKNAKGTFVSGDHVSVSEIHMTDHTSEQTNDQPWWKSLGAFLTWLCGVAAVIIALLTYLSDTA